ncbi:MAG TPA: NUDIX domain-containing protein [Nakamurella sp.]
MTNDHLTALDAATDDAATEVDAATAVDAVAAVDAVDAAVVAAHAALHADVQTVLGRWRPRSDCQAAIREAFLTLLEIRPDATARSSVPGHVTASSVVLSADRRAVLLTLHPRVGRWVQLGGHCEPEDITIAGAALREAREESGIADLQIDPAPVHLDIHPITCSLGRPTRHFDVRFRVIAPPAAVPAISAESVDLQFFPVDQLPDGVDDGVRAAVAAALSHPTEPD